MLILSRAALAAFLGSLVLAEPAIGDLGVLSAQTARDSSEVLLSAAAAALSGSSKNLLMARRLAETAAVQARMEHDVANVIRALRIDGHSYFNGAKSAQNMDSAAAFYKQAFSLSDTSRTEGTAAQIAADIGDATRLRGDRSEARRWYALSARLFARAHDSSGEAKTSSLLSLLYAGASDVPASFDSTQKYLQRALHLEKSSSKRAEYLVDVGDALNDSSDLAEAKTKYESAVAVADSGKDDAARAHAHRRYGEFLLDGENYTKASIELRKALRAAGASTDTTELLPILESQGNVLQATGYPDSALVYYQRALPLARSIPDTGQLQSIYSGIGDSYDLLDSLSEATAWYAKAIDLARAVADTEGLAVALTNSADVYRQLDSLPTALSRAREAYLIYDARGDASGKAGTLMRMAELFAGLQQPDSVKPLLRRADSLATANSLPVTSADIAIKLANFYETHGAPDSALFFRRRAANQYAESGIYKRALDVFNTIGIAFDRARQTDSAIANFRQAIFFLPGIKLGDYDASLLNDVSALFFRLNLSDSALVFGEQALAAFRSGGNLRRQADVLGFLGRTYSQLGRYERALALEDSALAIARRLNNRDLEATFLNNTGWQLARMNRGTEALSRIQKAITAARALSDSSLEASALHSAAFVYETKGLRDSAQVYYRRSLTLRRLLAKSTNESRLSLSVALSSLASTMTEQRPDSALSLQHQALTIARSVRDAPAEWEALRGIGRGLLRRGALGDLASATTYLDSAASLLSGMRGHAGEEANRVSLAEGSLALFEDWTLAWLGRRKEIGSDAAALASLAASERGRAQALVDMTRGKTTTFQPGADLVAEGRQLTHEINRPGEAAIVFFAAHDSLVTWVVTPSSTTVFVRPISRDSLAFLVARYRHQLGVNDSSTTSRLANRRDAFGSSRSPFNRTVVDEDEKTSRSAADNRLGRTLFSREILALLEGSRELVIIPQGPLSVVPFAALSVEGRRGVIADHFSVRYLPSLFFSTIQSQEPQTIDPARAGVVVGNPTMPVVKAFDGRTLRLRPLGKAASEAVKIASVLKTPVLLGPAATEQKIKSMMPSAPVVHLATHGYAYTTEQMSRESFVALAPGGKDDGLLTVGEIMDGPRLSANLFVLSACQTALGNLKLAEGTLGFQRALLSKGVQTVLVSLWNVSDDATSLLMTRFYFHWKVEGKSKADALRSAQNDLRTKPRFSDARYWAPFQLVGRD